MASPTATRAMWVILRKDLRLRLRDRSVWLFALVVPLGLTLLFSFVFPDPGDVHVRAAVVDLDGGQVTAGFVEGVLPALVDDGLITLVELADPDADAASAAVESGDLDAAWVFPSGFSAAVEAGQQAGVEVLLGSDAGIEAELAEGIATAYVREVERIALGVATVAAASDAPPTDETLQAVAEASLAAEPVITLREQQSEGGAGLDLRSYLAAGMAAFFVFFVVQFGVSGLLEERQQGTMPRLLAAPIPAWSVQAGKLLGALLLGLVSMAVLAVGSAVALGADWGPPGGVAILIVALVVAAIGVMAFVGSFARTAEQAGNLQSIVAVTLGLLGGVFFPVPADGGLLGLATAVSPHGWFMRGLTEVSVSGDWSVSLGPALAIAAFGLVLGSLGFLLQRGVAR